MSVASRSRRQGRLAGAHAAFDVEDADIAFSGKAGVIQLRKGRVSLKKVGKDAISYPGDNRANKKGIAATEIFSR